jgi:cysteine-rich repeat protein
MSRLSMLSLFLLACTAEGAAPQLPPPAALTLSCGALVSGGTTSCTASGASPGAAVSFLYGTAAPGPCLSFLGNQCLSVGSPRLLAQRDADRFGVATFSFPFPVVHGGLPLSFQAVEVAGRASKLSNALHLEAEVCGDGQVHGTEACDDANPFAGDGCTALCELETCGDGILQPDLGETCDDGNLASGDGCSATCVRTACPAGMVRDCDDRCTTPVDDGVCDERLDCATADFDAYTCLPPGDTEPVAAFVDEVHDVDSATYGATWARNRDLGYRVVSQDAVADSGGVSYSGLWTEVEPGILDWRSNRNLDRATLEQQLDDFPAQGQRLVDLSAHVVGGVPQFNVAFVTDETAPPWAYVFDVDEAGLHTEIARQTAAGLRPTRVSSWNDGGLRYAAIFVADGLDWQIRTDLDSAGYNVAWNELAGLGYQPADIDAVDAGTSLRYHGIWTRDPDVVQWASYRNMTPAGFDQTHVDLREDGYVLVDLDLYPSAPGASDHHVSAIFERRRRGDVVEGNIPLGAAAQSLQALVDSYDGHLGLYVEDLTNGNHISVNAHEPVYLASTAKVLIAAEVLRRVDNGVLTPNTQLEYRLADRRETGDAPLDFQVGQWFTVDQWMRWMINNSSTDATDRLVTYLGEDHVNTTDFWGSNGFGEITSVCELDKRIYEAQFPCVRALPCDTFERALRNDLPDATHQACIDSLWSRSPAEEDEAHDAYFHTLANSATPAAYGAFLNRLASRDPSLLSVDSANLLIDILDDTNNGSVDDLISNQGFYTGFGGKHGLKHDSKSCVGLAWERNGTADVAAATFEYSITVVSEDWADPSQEPVSRATNQQAILHALTALQAAR